MNLGHVRARLSDALSGKKFFIKVFFWFWLTVISTISGFVLVPHLTDIHVLRPPNLNAVAAPMLAAQAVHTYETEGSAAFLRFTHDTMEDQGKVLYMLDGDYRDVLSRPVADEGLRVAHLAKSGQVTVFRSEFAAFRYLSSSGRPYIFVLYLNPQYGRILGRTNSQQIVYGLGIVLAVTLLCFAFARHLASPIVSLQAATRRVSEGDLQARAPKHLLQRHDEMRDLARDFNTMVARIEALVQSQKRLLASVSHEVRSPLTRLTVAVALLRRLEREDTRSLLDRVDREVACVDVLMGQLLTLARLESGGRTGERRAINLTELLDEVIADVNFEIGQDDKSVSLVADATTIYSTDQAVLRSAFENVIRNAGRFTAKGTDVRVIVTHQEKDASVSVIVQDRGPGVPEEHLKTILQPFFRLDDGNSAPSGNGLGLTIAAEAILLHGGSIQATNREDGGLQVQILLPARFLP